MDWGWYWTTGTSAFQRYHPSNLIQPSSPSYFVLLQIRGLSTDLFWLLSLILGWKARQLTRCGQAIDAHIMNAAATAVDKRCICWRSTSACQSCARCCHASPGARARSLPCPSTSPRASAACYWVNPLQSSYTLKATLQNHPITQGDGCGGRECGS